LGSKRAREKSTKIRGGKGPKKEKQGGTNINYVGRKIGASLCSGQATWDNLCDHGVWWVFCFLCFPCGGPGAKKILRKMTRDPNGAGSYPQGGKKKGLWQTGRNQKQKSGNAPINTTEPNFMKRSIKGDKSSTSRKQWRKSKEKKKKRLLAGTVEGVGSKKGIPPNLFKKNNLFLVLGGKKTETVHRNEDGWVAWGGSPYITGQKFGGGVGGCLLGGGWGGGGCVLGGLGGEPKKKEILGVQQSLRPVRLKVARKGRERGEKPFYPHAQGVRDRESNGDSLS